MNNSRYFNAVGRHVRRSPQGLAAISLLGVLAGCGAESLDETDIASLNEPLRAERDGTVLFNDAARQTDPNSTRSGYAVSVYADGCSGAMIGPNLMMSAAHCDGMSATGVDEIDMSILVSRTTDRLGGWHWDYFKCRPLLRAFGDTDLMLYYCPDNAAGVTPGDLYGYLDFDVSFTSATLDVTASTKLAEVDTPVWTYWTNPLEQPSPTGDAIFQSRGKVTSRAKSPDWPSIQGNCGISTSAPIFTSDVWVKAGVSGSSTLSDRGRIVGGPTSTASGGAVGSAFLKTNAIIDYLTRTNIYSPTGAESSCDDHAQLNQTNLAALGLDWHNYTGAVDKNADGLFDVQLDAYKATMGSTVAPFYYLGFGSNLRNRAMTGIAAKSIIISPITNLQSSAILAPGETLRFPMAKVGAGKSYVFTGAVSTPIGFSLAPASRPNVCAGSACAPVDMQGTGAKFPFWTTTGLTPAADGTVSISNPSTKSITLWGLTVQKITAPSATPINVASQTFDTHDSRWIWRRVGDETTSALFLPFGEGSAVNFAMAISPTNSGSTTLLPHLSASNVCFDVRVNSKAGPLGPIAPTGTNRLQVSISSIVAPVVFSDDPASGSPISTATHRRCVPLAGASRVSFESTSGSFLIDNVQVTSSNQTD